MEKEMQPVAPFRGQWQRDGEHETKLDVSCGKYKLTIHCPWCDREDLERWLVETLHMWPHPNAPVAEGEFDYPTYRNAAYARLIED